MCFEDYEGITVNSTFMEKHNVIAYEKEMKKR